LTLALLAIAILVMLLLGAPLFAVILAATMLGFYSADIDLSVIGIEFFRLVNTPLLMALPLFTFTGYLLGEGRSSQRLVRLTRAFLGWMPSGLAVVALLSCALFTALTGASGVTIVALGSLLYPALKQAGHSEKFSLGLITSSGSLGLLLPPSIPLILYGIIVQQQATQYKFTFTDLFLAGILPGLFMILLLSLYAMWSNRYEHEQLTPFSAREALAAVREAAWEIPLPLFIFGGIFTGYLAVSELAAAAALYVLLIQLLVYKELRWSRLPALAVESMTIVGGILLILGVSLAFTNFLIDAEVPSRMFEWVKAHVDSKLTFLLLLNVFLLGLGAILDIFSALVIVVPLILPIAMGYGIHPLHLGIIFLANMQIGYFTPPVGMNLFIASYRFNKPVTELYHASIPFMLILMCAVLVITYWPDLSLALTR
jgi:C4-dicarboxylate transporter DctM subunit